MSFRAAEEIEALKKRMDELEGRITFQLNFITNLLQEVTTALNNLCCVVGGGKHDES